MFSNVVCLSVLLALFSPPATAPGVDPRVTGIVKRSGLALHVSAMRSVRVLHETLVASRPGASGPVENWIAIGGLRNAEYYAVPPQFGGTGWNGRDDWTLGQSGLVSVDGGDADREQTIVSAFIDGYDLWTPRFGGATVTYAGAKVEHRRAYDVLRIEAPGSRVPAELWFDRSTYLPVRLVEVVGPTTFTRNVSDYRSVRGLMIAFRENEFADGEPVTYETLTKIVVNPSDGAAHLAEPKSNVHDFSIAGDASQTVVAMERSSDLAYVPVMLDGKGPFRVIFDTNGQNVIDPVLARALGASKSAAALVVRRMRIGDAVLNDQPFFIAPVRAQSSAYSGLQADGIIGFEVLARFVTTFDYARDRVTLQLSQRARPQPGATVLPIVLDGQQPQFACAIEGIPAECTVNTGASQGIALFAPFAREHPQVVPSPLTAAGSVGSDTQARLGRLHELAFGPIVLRDAIADVTTQPDGPFGAPFVGADVGGAVWKRFTLTLDYSKLTMTLAPNARVRERETYDRSGLYVMRRDGACIVADVRPLTPAARAGLVRGEAIVAIDGRRATSLTLPSIRAMLADAPGTVVDLSVTKNGITRSVALTLLDYI